MSGFSKIHRECIKYALVKFSIRKNHHTAAAAFPVDLFERSAEKNCDNKLPQFNHEASCRKHPCPFKLFVLSPFPLIPGAFHTKASVIAHGQKVPRRHGRVFFSPQREESPTLNQRHCPLPGDKNVRLSFFWGWLPSPETNIGTYKEASSKGKMMLPFPNFQPIW